MSVEHLKKRADFLKTATTRHRWTSPGAVVQIHRRTIDRIGDGGGANHGNGDNGVDEACTRIGFTVTRHQVGNAVMRNRARRRLRAVMAIMVARESNFLPAGCDIVVIGRQATLTRPFRALVNDVRVALKRLTRRLTEKETL